MERNGKAKNTMTNVGKHRKEQGNIGKMNQLLNIMLAYIFTQSFLHYWRFPRPQTPLQISATVQDSSVTFAPDLMDSTWAMASLVGPR